MSAYDAWLDPPDELPARFVQCDDDYDDLEPDGDWGSDETEILRDNRYDQ